MTDATAIPINVFQNERELMVVAPMPGVAPEDISIEVTNDGNLTLQAAQHGEGQERIEYVLREWSYGPYARTTELPCAVDATRANVTFGNGVVSITFPKAEGATAAARLLVRRTGQARGVTAGHQGTRGGDADDPTPDDGSSATTTVVE